MGIDPETGIIKWEIGEWINESGEEVNRFPLYINRTGLGFQNGKYFMLMGNWFACFDFAKHQAILRKVITKDLNGDQIIIKETTFYEGRIYFTAQNETKRIWNIPGVFDIEKETILWQTAIDFPCGNDLFVAPAVDDNHIYLNDTTGQLYIFVKSS